VKVSEIIGKRVKQAREEAGISQRELGEQVGGVLNREGKPWFAQAVSAAEKGDRDWTADDLVAVAWVLRRPVAWFFQVMDEDQAEMLDLEGYGMIHAYWAGGLEQERTPDELAAEIARLTRKLQRALQEES
jgi:transcriptional regulator with XRE-family HTH domain